MWPPLQREEGSDPSTGGNSSGHSFTNWPSPPHPPPAHTHTHTHTHTYWLTLGFTDRWVGWVNWCWPSPPKSFLVLSPAGFMTLLYSLRLWQSCSYPMGPYWIWSFPLLYLMTEADPASEMLEILKFNWHWIIIFSGVRLNPLGTAATIGLLYQPQMIDDDDCGVVGGIKIGKGKPKYSEKTCPSATLSITNTTWSDPGSNPCRRGRKPATNRLSYSMAQLTMENSE
jgi:hypothetical protein